MNRATLFWRRMASVAQVFALADEAARFRLNARRGPIPFFYGRAGRSPRRWARRPYYTKSRFLIRRRKLPPSHRHPR